VEKSGVADVVGFLKERLHVLLQLAHVARGAWGGREGGAVIGGR
jgi:hypothetical protein